MGIRGVFGMDNQPRYFPRFTPVPPPQGEPTRYARVYIPGTYYSERWEYFPKPEAASQKAQQFVDWFFFSSAGLFLLTYFWSRGRLF